MTQPGDPGRWSLAAGLLLAGAAFLLRFALTGFPLTHPDEPIVAHLAERAIATGRVSVNWDGFPETDWSKPTYQFSPYSLLQIAVNGALRPADIEGHVRLARTTSCVHGAVAVFLAFLAGRRLRRRGQAGLVGAACLAVSLLHVQDSIYARVEAFLSLLILACLWLSLRALRRPGDARWGLLAALVGGIAVAAKYNTVPVLLLPFFGPCAQLWAKELAWRTALGRIAAQAVAVVAGFLLATPELLLDPGPFLAGLRSEWDHYTEGHVPHQAFDFGDNNLFYWSSYLAWLGFGLLPCLAALTFLAVAARDRRREYVLLGAYLAVTGTVALLVKVRFERNLETLLGPLAVAAGVGFAHVSTWVGERLGPRRHRLFVLAAVVLILWQPVVTLVRFDAAIHAPSPLVAAAAVPTETPFAERSFLDEPLPADRQWKQFFFHDYGDPFSRAGWEKWRRWLGEHEAVTFGSVWSRHAHPFSTVDIYHGPARVVVVWPGTRPR